MRVLTCSIAAVFLLAACGSGGPSQPAGSIKVTMTEFAFNPSSITTTHGKVVFFLVNSGSAAHDLLIRDNNKTRIAGSELVTAGDSIVFTVDNLPAGSYKIYCDQSGHEAAGMIGDLTVN
jgi:plastocyanin